MDQVRQKRFNTVTGAVHLVSINPATGAETDLGPIDSGVDLMLSIPRGHEPGMSCINKFGENPLVTKNTTEDVWDGGGTYSFPATADITHISGAVDQVAMRGETIPCAACFGWSSKRTSSPIRISA